MIPSPVFYHKISVQKQLHIIPLRITRYSDRHTILNAYSLEMGRISFLTPAGNGKEAIRRRALLMPLGIVECTATIRPDRDIHSMSDPFATVPLQAIHAHPMKSIIAQFLAEILCALLRETSQDTPLFTFIAQSSLILNDLPDNRLANFHLCFLYRLGQFIGIAPDTSCYRHGCVFDMLDGIFRDSVPSHRHFLTGDEATAVMTLSRITYRNMHLFRMNRDMRNYILDRILTYYTLHYTSLNSLRSLDVLRSLF